MKEDIEILEKIKESIDIDYGTGRRKVQAIENLINRNKELEQIEAKHKKENGLLREKVKELEEENHTQRSQLMSIFDRGFIHKSNIEEVIEELSKEYYKLDEKIDIKKPNKTMQDYYEDKERITTMQTISYVIGKLEEVLGDDK